MKVSRKVKRLVSWFLCLSQLGLAIILPVMPETVFISLFYAWFFTFLLFWVFEILVKVKEK